MENEIGVNDITLEDLDKLFSDDETENSQSQTETDNQESSEQSNKDTASDNNEDKSSKDVDTTKAFAKRLKESTDKARQEERETIAKSLGFDSYDSMLKSNEKKLMEEKGLDPEQVTPVVEELVKKRLNDDPRLKELETFRQEKLKEFAKKELAEINKLTDGEITDIKQLPKEVIDLWKQKGSLKAAYLELEGEKLITKIRSEQSKGSTSHLKANEGSNLSNSEKRYLTAEEKRNWLFFNPNTTEEELNKIMVDK